MDEQSLQQHLSEIATSWTLLKRAHGEPADRDLAAQAAVLERYQQAVYRYLLGALRNADAADELFQEFALRFVRGDFRHADAARGRFRDYVKTSLIHLVVNHHRQQGKQLPQAPEGAEPAVAAPEMFDSDAVFLASWRKAVLDRAWEALAAAQKPGGPPFHRAMQLRTEEPGLSSGQLAERLTAELRPTEPYSDAAVRKIVQRAREMFTDFLVEEVARSLRDPSPEALEQELIDLGFQAYCQKALDRRRGQNP